MSRTTACRISIFLPVCAIFAFAFSRTQAQDQGSAINSGTTLASPGIPLNQKGRHLLDPIIYIYIYILLYTYNYWNQQNPNQLTRKLDTLWWQQTSTCFQHCVMPDTLLMSCCITSESIQWKGCCNVPQPPQPPTGPGRCSGECWRSTCMGALGQLTDRKGSEEVQWISFR